MEKEEESIFDEFPIVKIKDPLSEVTRKERRSLLGVSILGLLVVKIGILPEEITALGIKFTVNEQSGLITLFVLIILFYLIAFLIYALSDFIAWRLAFLSAVTNSIKESRKQPVKDSMTMEDGLRFSILQKKWATIATPTSVARAFFEFIVPIVITLYSIILLLTFKLQ
ncbi:MAG: hypothetical protein NTX44_05155 [Ignavibacteriales bacterium]|nr:hypothetical protein [Ignavibacteriales bacterium]